MSNGIYRVCSFIGPDRYQKHLFIGTVGVRPFNESGSVWNYQTVGPQSGAGTARIVRLLRTVPVPVRTNKRTHPYCVLQRGGGGSKTIVSVPEE
jgi:hypothetical protein